MKSAQNANVGSKICQLVTTKINSKNKFEKKI